MAPAACHCFHSNKFLGNAFGGSNEPQDFSLAISFEVFCLFRDITLYRIHVVRDAGRHGVKITIY